MKEVISGIEFKHVIMFQTQVMMGNQFGRIIWAREQSKGGIKDNLKDEILVACLRMGWNDAFRHVSLNQKEKENDIAKYGGNDLYKDENGKKADFDDYYCKIIKEIIDVFKEYAIKKYTADKCERIYSNFEKLEENIGEVKKTEKDVKDDPKLQNKALCFGHIQKMFNIALKLYLCLYMCREHLELGDLFYADIIEALKYADCPIDSIVLNKLDEKKQIFEDEYREYGKDEKGKDLVNKKFSDIKWSQIGNTCNKKSTIHGYKRVQDAIAKYLGEGKSNLYFDFTEWKNNETSLGE